MLVHSPVFRGLCLCHTNLFRTPKEMEIQVTKQWKLHPTVPIPIHPTVPIPINNKF